jgi:hypothetical protein
MGPESPFRRLPEIEGKSYEGAVKNVVNVMPEWLSEYSLVQISEREHQNLLASHERLSAENEFISRLRRLYDVRSDVTEDQLVPYTLFHDAGRALVVGVLSTWRGHINDGMALTRRAIEGVAYAHVATDPKHAQVWLKSSSKDSDFWKAFQRGKFRKRFPHSDELKTRWERSSEYGSHATFSSQVNRTRVTEKSRLRLAYFDMDGNPDLNIKLATNWTINTHCVILRAFWPIFENVFGEEWRADLKKLELIPQCSTDFYELS